MSMSVPELEHHAKVVDMMLTAHSKLRDRNHFLGRTLEIIMLGASVVLCATVFLDRGILDLLHLDPGVVTFVLGICSVIVFFLSLVGVLVDWTGTAGKHAEAVRLLARCKADCQKVLKGSPRISSALVEEVCHECVWAFTMIPPIPESKFLRLKAIHKAKREISGLIDRHPGCPVVILRTGICIRAICRFLRKAEVRGENNGKQTSQIVGPSQACGGPLQGDKTHLHG